MATRRLSSGVSACSFIVCCLCGCLGPSSQANMAWATGLVAPQPQGPAVPAGVPDAERIKGDPVGFLKECLAIQDARIHGYSCLLSKQERISGSMQQPEEIWVDFREKPFSVRMSWRRGAGIANSALYVEGENDDKIVAQPRGILSLAGQFERAIDSSDAQRGNRYRIDGFGMKKGMKRTLAAWEAAKARNELVIEYLGIQRPPECDERPCHVLRRPRYPKPEEDGISDLTIWIDAETRQQVRSVMFNDRGKLLGSYSFSDIRINPAWPADTFKRSSLK
ncbi:MAG: DUF1571 domain-containing protein [Planctomycetes bacterium]|nr:DUF1571 domain-containing protein [Planctomycetota bacterium]